MQKQRTMPKVLISGGKRFEFFKIKFCIPADFRAVVYDVADSHHFVAFGFKRN